MASERTESPGTLVNRRALLRTTAVAAAGAGACSPTRLSPQDFRRGSRAIRSPSAPYRIDLHAHFLPPDYRAALLSHGHLTIGGYPTPQWSPEATLDFMGRYGIAAQVLSVSDPGVDFLPPAEAIEMARYCNTYAADLFRTHRERFGGLAVLPMHDVGAALAEVEHALDHLRLDGVVLLSAYNGAYLGDPRFEPLMRALDARSAYVFVHPAAIPDDAKPSLPLPDFLEEFTFDTTRAASLLIAGGTLARYPNIRFQLAHAGGTVPFLAYRLGIVSRTPIGEKWPDAVPRPSALDVSRHIRGFFYDTALSPAPSAMRSVLAVTELDHIVFGSDWPFSALALSGSGDPQPELSETFDVSARIRIERDNSLRELPRLASVVAPL